MAEESITIKVKRTSGEQTTELSIKPSSSILELKQAIEAQTQVPPSGQRLIHKGRILKDESTVESFKIAAGEMVLMQVLPNTTVQPSSTTPAAAAVPSSAPISSAANSPGCTEFQSSVASLVRSNSRDAARVGLETLVKVIDNIMSHPNEEKYRKLKINNATFSRKLGGIPSGLDCVKGLGFEDSEDGVLQLTPTSSAWDHLSTCRSVVTTQLASLTAPTQAFPNQPMPQMPAFGGMQGLPPMPPNLGQMAADPQFIQQALANPLVQQMMANDPRMAQHAEMLRQNPGMIQEMMSNPLVQQMMSNPQAMQQAMQMASSMNPQGAGAPFGMPPQFGQQPFPQQIPNFSPPPAFQPPAQSTTTAPPTGQPQPQTGNPPQQTSSSSEGKTEEELINEAIQRSLQDQ